MATNDGSPLKTLLLVAVIATAAAAIVSASWEFSRERIAANRRARLIDNLNSVLDADLAGRNLNPMALSATDPDLLGQEGPVDVFVPMQGDQAVAAIFGTVAPHGYNAPIYLLIGISAASGQIMGVRVVSHRETPGLGDQIEIRKSNWILQFDGRTIESPDTAGWAVDKDDGAFDSITGATVTPRAVIEAVHNTLIYYGEHRNELFEAARRAQALGAADD